MTSQACKEQQMEGNLAAGETTEVHHASQSKQAEKALPS